MPSKKQRRGRTLSRSALAVLAAVSVAVAACGPSVAESSSIPPTSTPSATSAASDSPAASSATGVSPDPTPKAGLSPSPSVPGGAIGLTAGWYHTCALVNSAVKCWGHNGAGQLGDGGPIFEPDCGNECFGDILDSPSEFGPYAVVGLDDGVTMVDAGWYQTCAVTSGGAARCWGYNEDGELGDGSILWSSTPRDVVGLSTGVVQVSTGYWTSCALTDAGAVSCWGYGVRGEDIVTTPVEVSGFSDGPVAIAVGNVMACVVTVGGGVNCWTTDGVDTPHALDGLDAGVVQLSVGDLHACAVMESGAVRCWGGNLDGALGDGTTDDRPHPVDVLGITDAVLVAAGGIHSCALTSVGAVKCWGANYYGGLGNGTIEDALTPVDVTGIESGAVSIAAGAEHTCAAMNDATVKCWGSNFAGQLGASGLELEQSETPVVVDLGP